METKTPMRIYAEGRYWVPESELAQAKTTMVAAAEEIAEHWDAHCDAEGYGPANLMRRLEEGIPSQYGYTAGAFAQLRANAERYRWLQEHTSATGLARWMGRHQFLDAAVDAAIRKDALAEMVHENQKAGLYDL